MKVKIAHSRKGTFVGEIDGRDLQNLAEDFIEVKILEGRANYISGDAVAGATIVIRKSFCKITPIGEDHAS